MENNPVDSILQHCLNLIRFLAKNRFKLGQKPMHLISDQAVKDVIIATQIEYQKSSKQDKSKLLDSIKLITKRDRKHSIRLLNETLHDLQQAKRSGRPLIYNKSELIPHIRYLWLQMETVSPYRMREGLKDWLPHYKECPAHLRMQLLKMSGATLGRYMGEIRETLEIPSKLGSWPELERCSE
jgi:hypothetical protein